MYPYYFDSTMIILIPAIIIAIWAQTRVSSTYKKYKKIGNRNGYTGEQIARMMLDEAGLFYVPIQVTNGELSDHYDPRSKVVRLSHDIYYGKSIAAAGIAAHEVGHAIQHNEEYAPLVLRTTIATGVGYASQMSMVLFFLGIFLSMPGLTTIGIIFFSASVIYQLVTLPVEFNASNRALAVLERRAILFGDEVQGAKKVLNAAAMTYVAATLMALAQLIRLIALSNRNND